MKWRQILYPGEWSVRFMIIALLIWIVKLLTGTPDPFVIGLYYACAVAAFISLIILAIGVVKVITEGEPVR
jgi:hypothetical protein